MSVTETISQYYFENTAGRERVAAAYTLLIGVLNERAEEHKAHGNRALREMALRSAQHAMSDLERYCAKWEESDRRGLTY